MYVCESKTKKRMTEGTNLSVRGMIGMNPMQLAMYGSCFLLFSFMTWGNGKSSGDE